MKRCTPAKHKAAAKHRASEAKYVRNHHARHLSAVKRSQRKHRTRVLAKKKAARAGNRPPHNSPGRPREC